MKKFYFSYVFILHLFESGISEIFVKRLSVKKVNISVHQQLEGVCADVEVGNGIFSDLVCGYHVSIVVYALAVCVTLVESDHYAAVVKTVEVVGVVELRAVYRLSVYLDVHSHYSA